AVLCGGQSWVCGAESNRSVSRPEPIAPGIWRIRLGQPEKLTPTHFQTIAVDKEKLKSLPAVDYPLLDAKEIGFEVSARGCVITLPLDSDENIYGFGLSTKLFEMTQSDGGHKGRRVFLKPTDHPENELGESHAPVPFYCSSRG